MDESKANEKRRIKDQINAINNRKNKADKKVEKRIKRLRWLPWGTIVFVIILVCLGTYFYDWNKMEFWTWLFAIIIASIPWLVFGLGFKEWNPQNVIDVWYKNKYTKKLYSEYDIDLSKLQDLENSYNS